MQDPSGESGGTGTGITGCDDQYKEEVLTDRNRTGILQTWQGLQRTDEGKRKNWKTLGRKPEAFAYFF